MLKYFSTDKATIDIEDGERAVIATISNSSVDRDNEVVLPKGGNLEQFQKNPVVLWAHESWNPPIGKMAWVKVTAKGIVAKTIFATTERADEIYELFKGGFLRAFSIGFESKERRLPTAKEIEKNPDWKDVRFVHAKWDLFEYSVVPIPANPGALAIAVGKGLKVSDELMAELTSPVVKECLTSEPEPEPEPEVKDEPRVMVVRPKFMPVTIVPPKKVTRIMPCNRYRVPVVELLSDAMTQKINQIKGIV